MTIEYVTGTFTGGQTMTIPTSKKAYGFSVTINSNADSLMGTVKDATVIYNGTATGSWNLTFNDNSISLGGIYGGNNYAYKGCIIYNS